jgi:hypothetical protein
MLKWIGGILLALVLLVGGSCWYAYRKLTGEGNVATVTVAATPEQVWQMLTEPDSIRTWFDSTARVTFSTDSTLVPGDTITLRSQAAADSAREGMMLVLERAEAPALLVWRMVADSMGPGTALLRRTDSVIALGDSVRIVSVATTPSFDSLSDSMGGLGRRMMNASSRMVAGGFRLMAQHQLEALRARVQPR